VDGEAVIHYGYPRFTGDINIFFSLSDINVSNLYQVLAEFWNDDIPGINDKKELKTPGYVIQFGVPPNRIDLMNTIDGVDFKEAWSNKKLELLKTPEDTVKIYYMGLEELIKNKKASGREKDLDDLSYLSQI